VNTCSVIPREAKISYIAEVIQAEAEVPKALAQALRDGNMGFMDYYKFENLKGDTAMRDAISKIDPTNILNKDK